MPDYQTLLYGNNAPFVEALYEDYLTDPTSVTDAWRGFFDAQRDGAADVSHTAVQAHFAEIGRIGAWRFAEPPIAGLASGGGAARLIDAYRYYGHLCAATNPIAPAPTLDPELDPALHGVSPEELNNPATAGPFSGPLSTVVESLKKTYCGPIGFETVHLPRAEREWFLARIETWGGGQPHTPELRRRILSKLNAAEGLERYLHKRYVGQKRFSLEGGESLMPMLDQTIQTAGARGGKEVVIGMAHRGRLNVLVNLMGKTAGTLFLEFEGKKVLPGDLPGDVKYHMGFSSDVETPGGPVHLSLGFNPSHLELIDPVVEGSVRARQDRRHDARGASVVPLLIHGDAAAIGQGVVFETLNMSQLRGYKTGGTIHLVINNQVGFSISDPRDTRTSRYCTDGAKMIEAPVFHVNGDDPDACVFAALLALDYREAFNKDVFIDLVCYRRHGHNEADEPRATQPQMYHVIDKHDGTRQIYAEKLEAEGVIAAGYADSLVEVYRERLDQGARTADAVETEETSPAAAPWSAFKAPDPGLDMFAPVDTTMTAESIQTLGAKLLTMPEGFALHKSMQKLLEDRRKMLAGELPIDFGMAENLAYAGLLTDGIPVRMSGQDIGRGTFFHRHAVFHDQREGISPLDKAYIPLANLTPDQARYDVIDSTLSEEAVLAFEYGYSTTEPRALVMWEAQFGDFANGAQAVIDQYIASGEVKWLRYSGLVMMLPHGYEGQGPEHSSARPERYLQLCGDNNMQVIMPSTAAQMFHALRRQVVRTLRKPLIIMSPKSLLRLRSAGSSLDDLTKGTFHEVIGDDTAIAATITRVVLCSGKHYHDLVDAREKRGQTDIALVRVEQLYPFPQTQVAAELAKYGQATIVWSQEEPANGGAWQDIRDGLQAAAGDRAILCASRPRSASPAVGYMGKHNFQQARLIEQALGAAPVAAVEAVETANA